MADYDKDFIFYNDSDDELVDVSMVLRLPKNLQILKKAQNIHLRALTIMQVCFLTKMKTNAKRKKKIKSLNQRKKTIIKTIKKTAKKVIRKKLLLQVAQPVR